MQHAWFKAAALAALAATLVVAAACKDNNNAAPASGAASPVATAQVAPTTAVATTAASPAAGGATPALGGGAAAAGPQTITEVTTDDKFSVTAIAAKVGQPLTITVQNKGAAIHNWALTDAAGKAAVSGPNMVPLVNGGETQSITFTFTKTGTFDFNCQVHPTEMTGKVTVTQ